VHVFADASVCENKLFQQIEKKYTSRTIKHNLPSLTLVKNVAAYDKK